MALREIPLRGTRPFGQADADRLVSDPSSLAKVAADHSPRGGEMPGSRAAGEYHEVKVPTPDIRLKPRAK